jgi:hypothetical protein
MEETPHDHENPFEEEEFGDVEVEVPRRADIRHSVEELRADSPSTNAGGLSMSHILREELPNVDVDEGVRVEPEDYDVGGYDDDAYERRMQHPPLATHEDIGNAADDMDAEVTAAARAAPMSPVKRRRRCVSTCFSLCLHCRDSDNCSDRDRSRRSLTDFVFVHVCVHLQSCRCCRGGRDDEAVHGVHQGVP